LPRIMTVILPKQGNFLAALATFYELCSLSFSIIRNTMSHLRAVSLMILVTLLWSMAGVVTRHLDSAPSFEVTFWRSGFNALALAIALTLIRGPGLWRSLLHAPRALWGSGLCWAVMFTAFMVAITLTTVANVLITLAIGPLITALFARIFLKHHLPPATWLAIAVASLGIAWMFRQEGDVHLSLLGTLVALAVPFSGAVNFTILQHVGLDRVKLLVDGDRPAEDMLPAVLIGAMLSALATLPLSWPFQASAHDLCLLAQLEVIFGVTWAWLWAGEQPSANTLSGGTLVIGALVANELTRMYHERIISKKIRS
jgi:drug/metabolite transporter (DMT)-like permease